MPKITAAGASSRELRIRVDARVADRYLSALARARDAGLRVDCSQDFERLIERLARQISDAAAEVEAARQAPPSGYSPE